MSISTKTGDTGTTALLNNRRVPKNHPRICALGDCDELTAAIGVAKAHLGDEGVVALVEKIQRWLIELQGDIACANEDRDSPKRNANAGFATDGVALLSAQVVELERSGFRFKGFVLPGSNPASAHLHLARSVCRRAERALWGLVDHGHSIEQNGIVFLNRLSDLLWLLALRNEG